MILDITSDNIRLFSIGSFIFTWLRTIIDVFTENIKIPQPCIDTISLPMLLKFTCMCHFINIVILNNPKAAPKLKTLLHKFQSCHHDLIDRYEMSISQITMNLFLSTYVFSNFLCHYQYFDRTWLYIWVASRVSYKKQELLTFSEHPSSFPVFFWFFCFFLVFWFFVFFCFFGEGGSVSLIIFVFCVVLIYVFTLLVSCCDVSYDFRIETMFVFSSSCLKSGSCRIVLKWVCLNRVMSIILFYQMYLCSDFRIVMSACERCSVGLYPKLFVGGLMFYLRTLYLFEHSVVQPIKWCVSCFIYLPLMFCIPNVNNVSGLFIFDFPLVFTYL